MSRYKQPYCLYKRGRYWYYKTYRLDGTRTVGKSTGMTNKTEAKRYLDSLFSNGLLIYDNITFKSFAEHFYDDDGIYFKDRMKKPAKHTIISYRKELKKRILPFFGESKLIDVNYIAIKEFRASLIKEGLAGNTIQITMSILKHIIDSAYKSQKIPRNPFDFLEKINFQKKQRDAFSLEEVTFIYNNIGEEFQKTVLLMALTGMRISEAVGVTDSDLKKTKNGVEYIDLTRQFLLGGYEDLKTGMKRPIPIIPEIKPLFGFTHTRLGAFYRAMSPLKNQLEQAEDRNLAFHSLRHFFITNAKAMNVSDSKVEFIAGHELKKTSHTEKIYTNYKADDLTDILQWQKDTLKKITAQTDSLNGERTL